MLTAVIVLCVAFASADLRVGVLHTGRAAFHAFGGAGQCHYQERPSIADNYLKASIGKQFFGDSIACGACIEFEGTEDGLPFSGKQKAFVEGLCGDCEGADIGLSLTGTKKYALQWALIPCEGSNGIQYLQKPSSSATFLEFQVRNHRLPVASIDAKVGNEWVPLVRKSYNFFTGSGFPAAVTFPLQLRLTDTDGQVIVDAIRDLPGKLQDGNAQFTSVDACHPNPCANGKCVRSSGEYYCLCAEGFTGINCTKALPPCGGDCGAGKCEENRCVCPTGFAGKHCEVALDDACKPNPCEHGKCQAYSGEYACDCEAGWEGWNCDQATNECAKSPCQHGKCEDVGAGYLCHCEEGFAGQDCDHELKKVWPEAEPKACEHGVLLVPEEESVYAHMYSDADADSGARLRKQEVVAGEEVAGEGEEVPGEEVPGEEPVVLSPPQCVCENGWTGESCADNINDCAEKPCKNGGKCEDLVGGFMCECASNWAGETCEENRNMHFDCPCEHGTCTDVFLEIDPEWIAEPDSSMNVCECAKGWEGPTCSQHVVGCTYGYCENFGYCYEGEDEMPICYCAEGFEGEHCETAVEEVSEACKKGCHNGGVCENNACVCLDNFEGERCEDKIPSCKKDSCKNGAKCVEGKVTGFKCKCAKGFTGKACELVDVCSPNPCKHDGVCTIESEPGVGESFTCNCAAGWEGEVCEKVQGNPDDIKDQFECKATGAPAFDPWKLNVVAMDDIGSEAKPYGADYQGRFMAGDDIYVRGFDTNLENRHGSDLGASIYAGGDVNYRDGEAHYGGIEAGGDVTLQGTTIDGDIVAGGVIKGNAGTVKGSLSARKTVQATGSLSVGGDKKEGVTDAPRVDVVPFTNYFKSVSTAAGALTPNAEYKNQWGTIVVEMKPGRNVIEMSASEFASAHVFKVKGSPDGHLIVNIPDEEANLDSMVWEYEGVEQGTALLNFPNARSIKQTSAQMIALLAPYSEFDFPNGLITGHLIVGSLSGMGQVNDDFRFQGDVSDLAGTPICIGNKPRPADAPKADPCTPNPCENEGVCTKVATGFKCSCSEGFTGSRCAVASNPTFDLDADADSGMKVPVDADSGVKDNGTPYWPKVRITNPEKIVKAELQLGKDKIPLEKQNWGESDSGFTFSPRAPIHENEHPLLTITDTDGDTTTKEVNWDADSASKCGDGVCAIDEIHDTCPQDCFLDDEESSTKEIKLAVKNYDEDSFKQAISDKAVGVAPHHVSVLTTVPGIDESVTYGDEDSLSKIRKTSTDVTTVAIKLEGVNANHADAIASTLVARLNSDQSLAVGMPDGTVAKYDGVVMTPSGAVESSQGKPAAGAGANGETPKQTDSIVWIFCVIGVVAVVGLVVAGVVITKRQSRTQLVSDKRHSLIGEQYDPLERTEEMGAVV